MLLLSCTWNAKEHGFWPRRHHPEAIANAHFAAVRGSKQAAVTESRMHAGVCLICGAELVAGDYELLAEAV